MAADGAPQSASDSGFGLEKIKQQLAFASGRSLLQGPLLKRSETLRKWNERWVILDPTTARMEYKLRRTEAFVKGTIMFDADSTITISPVNFHGLPKYERCCFYIGTPQKKDYFLCAETPGAANAWVSTLHSAQLVLKVHREAVNSLSGKSSATLGTVSTVVAAANSSARESSKEIEAAMQISMRNALGAFSTKISDTHMDDLTIMKETLRVKDEELRNLSRHVQDRDLTIKNLVEKLSETANAAEAAASAALKMDEQRRTLCEEILRVKADSEKQLESYSLKLKALEEKEASSSKEAAQITKHRDSALQEAHLWRSELAKARENVVILEAAVLRAEEKARVTEANADARTKEALQREAIVVRDKQELVAYIHMLQAQIQRKEIDALKVYEKTESFSGRGDTFPATKDVEENMDVGTSCRDVPRPGMPGEGHEWSDILPDSGAQQHIFAPVLPPVVDNNLEQGGG